MGTSSESLKGPRLEFVVREIPGTIKRQVTNPPPSARQREADPSLEGKTNNEREQVVLPAGFMVYLPSGHCYRMGQKELIRRGFHRQPNVLNREQATDVSTPAGRFMLAIHDADRKRAYQEMEDEVIRNCVRQVGKNHLQGIIADYDPEGEIERRAA